MRRRFVVFFMSVILSCIAVSAQEIADTLAVSDSLELSDAEIMKMLSSPQVDTVKKIDRGYDVGRMINARRQRAADFTLFRNESFMSNTFASVGAKVSKLLSEDYSFGLMGQVSVGKWLHQDHAVRLGYSLGKWQDNFDGSPINSMELEASYLFNLSSYVGGYRTNRLCEVMIVSGVGYANSFHNDQLTHAFSAHVGANLNMRLFKNIDFFIEPSASLYTNGMAVSYAGNWRTWLSAFQTSVGLSYNIMPSQSGDSPLLYPRTDGWYVSLLGGPHFQNSHLVHNLVGLGKSMGVHIALGIGKYYNDYFSFRYSGAFSRGSWVIYGDEEMPCNYFVARAEGMLDLVGLFTKKKNKKPVFAASLLFGPEIGYMHKVDHDFFDHDKELIVDSVYMGVCGGLQFKVRPARRLGLFFEPRFSLIPYEAPYYEEISLNDFRNYYDAIINLNFGIEFLL